MSKELQDKMLQVVEEARSLAAAASRIALMAHEVLEQGGTLQHQSTMHYLVGSLMRLQKDLAMVEYKQSKGAFCTAKRRIVS